MMNKFIEMMPDLEKKYPTNKDRYTAYIKLTYAAFFLWIVGKTLPIIFAPTTRWVGYQKVVEEPSLTVSILIILVSICAIIFSLYLVYANIYVQVKSGALSFLLKLILGTFLGFIAMMIVTSILGPFGIVLSLILAIFANHKRIYILKKYKDFVLYSLGIFILPFVCIIIGLAVAAGSALHFREYSNVQTVGYLIALSGFLAPVFITHFALRREEAKGRDFYETVRLITVIPVTIILCLISFLTLSNINGLSGDSVFGEPGNDFLGGKNLDSTNEYASDVSTQQNQNMSTFTSHTVQTNSFSSTSQEGVYESIVENGTNYTTLSNGITLDSNGLPVETPIHSTTTQNNTNDVSGSLNSNFANQSVDDDNIKTSQNELFTQTSHTIIDNSAMQQGRVVQTSSDTFVLQDQMSHQVSTAHASATGDLNMTGSDGHSQVKITSEGNIQGTDGMSQGSVKDVNGTTVIKDSSGMMKVRITENGDIIGADGQTIGHVK